MQLVAPQATSPNRAAERRSTAAPLQAITPFVSLAGQYGQSTFLPKSVYNYLEIAAIIRGDSGS
jgi:hypothetical protein